MSPPDASATGRGGLDAPSRPVRVVLVTHFFPAHRGGIEVVAGALARELGAAGAEVTWFASDCDPAPSDTPGVAHRPVRAWNGLEPRLGAPFPLWSPVAIGQLLRAIRLCDVVHVHDYVYPGCLAAWALAALAGKPRVVTQHVGAVPLGNPLLRAGLRLTGATLGRYMLRRSTTVFVSEVVRREFFPEDPERAHVVANGVDQRVFSPVGSDRRRALRRALGLSDARPVFLFVGRFVAKKGLGLLAQVVPKVPGVDWVFAGWGQMDPARWNQPHLRVVRDRSGPALADVYRAADLLVLPSVGEGFPLVVQEAMACGTPAIVGRETAQALPDLEGVLMAEDVVGEGVDLRWYRQLQALADNPAELTARRAGVAAWAEGHWSWPRCASSYLSLYDRILTQ